MSANNGRMNNEKSNNGQDLRKYQQHKNDKEGSRLVGGGRLAAGRRRGPKPGKMRAKKGAVQKGEGMMGAGRKGGRHQRVGS